MDINTVSVILQAIQQIGFPAVISLYLIWRQEQVIKEISNKLEKLESIIYRLNMEIKLLKERKDVDNDN